MTIKLQNYIFDTKKKFIYLFLKQYFVYFDVHKKYIYIFFENNYKKEMVSKH